MSNPLCSNKSQDFKGQSDSTQTIAETNSLVSLTVRKLATITSRLTLGSFIRSLDLQAQHKNTSHSRKHPLPALRPPSGAFCSQPDDILSFYQRCGLQQLLGLVLSRSVSTLTNTRCKHLFCFVRLSGRVPTAKDRNNIMRAEDNRMSC